MVGAVNANKSALAEYKTEAAAIASAVSPANIFGGVVVDADDSSGSGDNHGDSNDDEDKDDDSDSEAGTLQFSVGGFVIAAGIAFIFM